MSGRFNGPAFFSGASGYDRESGFHRGPFKFRIHFEVAEILFLDNLFPIVSSQIRARTQTDFRDSSGELGCTIGAFGDGARYGIDDDVFRVGIFFGSAGIFHSENVACTLDERVLEASAGGEEGPVVHARELDAFQHAVETLVGTAGRGPKAVERFQSLGSAGREQRRRRQPNGFQFDAELMGGVLEGFVGGVMRPVVGIEVAENSDPDGFGHGVILTVECELRAKSYELE